MDIKGYQQCQEQNVNDMTPGQLLTLLYDELVKRVARAELALERQNYDLFEESVDRSIDIIHYLDDTLDPQYPISGDLTRLYEFFCYELCRVKAGRNRTELARIKPMVM
ncbi:MAG: flagellar export chaperone FliS, partial [Oscillospiraceae bacterium]